MAVTVARRSRSARLVAVLAALALPEHRELWTQLVVMAGGVLIRDGDQPVWVFTEGRGGLVPDLVK